MEERLIKTKDDRDFPEDVIEAYLKIIEVLNYRATVSNFMEMLKLVANDGKDWEFFDSKNLRNIEFESFLIDCIRDFSNGKSINFTELVERLYSYAEFTEREKYELFHNRITYKLWAMFLVLANININK